MISCPPSDPLCGPDGCAAGCGALSTCGQSCVDLNVNPAHCGTCDTPCAGAPDSDATCTGGHCGFSCHAGYGACGTAGCVALQTYYPDKDGDGYGTNAGAITACPGVIMTGFATLGGDCLDTDPTVNPGAPGSKGPYTNLSGQWSYDYDCDGVETEVGTYTHFTLCGPPQCNQAGWRPADPRPTGPPPGADPFCGSSYYTNCSGSMSGASCGPFNTFGNPISCK
jgi:hypothetical protein